MGSIMGMCRAVSGQGKPAVYMDLASLGTLPKYTCGHLYSMPAFAAARDGAKLANAVRHGRIVSSNTLSLN